MSCKGCLVLGAALVLAMLLLGGLAVMTVGQFLSSTDTLYPADAIVILGGDSYDFARVQQAVHLFHQGYAPTVVFSGVPLDDTGLAYSWVQQLLGVAEGQGLPADAAMLIYGARSTYDEAADVRRLVQQYGWHSLIIVTHPFHVRRAGRTFRTLLPDLAVYVSAAPDPDYDIRYWWQTEDGLITVFSEVIKLGFYWVKYGITPA